METKALGFIGYGRITKIFLQAMDNKEIIFPSIVVCDIDIWCILLKQFAMIKPDKLLKMFSDKT